MSASSNPLPAGPALQRRPEERTRDDWIELARTDPHTLYLVARGPLHLVREAPQGGIAFCEAAGATELDLPETQQTLLGWFLGKRCVLLDVPESRVFEPPDTRYQELRPLLAQLSEDEAQLLIYARALLIWRARNRHCGVCGAPTAPRNAGHTLVCTANGCGAQVFPRIDPAIIVLVSDGPRVLLGRQPSWPAGRYSTLAGFVEVGEGLEEAVIREVREETGAQVQSMRYFGSQPWPFPSSLMLGFHAQAPQQEIRLDGELEDARWFEADELRAAHSPLLLPPAYTIARRLIDAWLRNMAQSGLDP